MRLQVFSDLHVDVRQPKPIAVTSDVDAVVVAGDVCEGAEHGFAWLRGIVPMHIPIIAVMGNHEFYRRCWHEEVAQARSMVPRYGVHLLENDEVIVGNVRFIGCTLWTDYALFGEGYVPLAMHAAGDGLNDHRRITWTKEPWARFRPQEALFLHRRSRACIEATLAKPFSGGATVVLSHHAPHPGSVHPRYGDDLLSAALVSDLTAVIEAGQPQLWVHGHVHNSFDYQFGATRIVCNPHGYAGENPSFNPALVIDPER